MDTGTNASAAQATPLEQNCSSATETCVLLQAELRAAKIELSEACWLSAMYQRGFLNRIV